jgi:hypothetical protein
MSELMAKEVAKRYIESGGRRKMGEVMREVGYSANSAQNPQKLTRSNTYIEALKAIGVDENYKAQKLKELIDDEKTVKIYGKQGTVEKEIKEKGSGSPKGLDMLHRVCGDYAPEEKHVTGAMSLTELFDGVTEEEESPQDDQQ